MSDTKVAIEPEENGKEEKPRGCGPCGKKKKATESDESQVPSVPFTQILATSPESYWMMAIGSLLALINGASFPAFSIVFGKLFNVFLDPTLPNRDVEIRNIALIFLGIGFGVFLCSYLSNMLWLLTGERIVRKIRKQFFDALLRQEIAFFDKTQSGVLVSRLSGDAAAVQYGISEKFSMVFYYFAQIVGGLIVAFVNGWKMTLVMLATSPAMISVGALQNYMLTRKAKAGQTGSAQANSVAQETIGGIRTIYSFVAEDRLGQVYEGHLKKAYSDGIKRAHMTGLGAGFAFFFMFAVYSLGFWYGGQLVLSGEMLGGDVLTVFFAIVIGAMGIGQASSISPDIAKASGAAAILFDIIKRTPGIANSEGKRLEHPIKGQVTFKNVSFAYPSRPKATVLQKFNLKLKPGQTIALVGPSGGGKSTVVQLLERFYDVSEGSVTVDGINIKEYDLKWLRGNIGLVSQEPILFSGSIAENIRYGNEHATDDQVQAAAKLANAHSFITDLKEGYETQVGERGIQLSGGQKQRVAIARAVLKDPKILLLDEATSALDAESEHLVQSALDKLMKGRTTIVIAHRLSTIQDADKICVIKSGEVVEVGSHQELLEHKGTYAELFQRQFATFDEKAVSTAKSRKHKKEASEDANGQAEGSGLKPSSSFQEVPLADEPKKDSKDNKKKKRKSGAKEEKEHSKEEKSQ